MLVSTVSSENQEKESVQNEPNGRCETRQETCSWATAHWRWFGTVDWLNLTSVVRLDCESLSAPESTVAGRDSDKIPGLEKASRRRSTNCCMVRVVFETKELVCWSAFKVSCGTVLFCPTCRNVPEFLFRYVSWWFLNARDILFCCLFKIHKM